MVAKTMARAQQQHGFVFQLLGGHCGLLRQGVRHGHGGHERLVIQRRNGQARIGERFGQNGAIGFAGAQHFQQFDGEVFLQHQRHLRRLGNHLSHQAGQQIRSNGVDHTQTQGPG